jgi:glycolate oxidase iron-sulfur subunit
MQTQLSQSILHTREGEEADRILRACVHCGFCNATCPTYQLLGDELDGPRGRIYQIKMALEGHAVGAETRLHLDRCLTCLNCETTCPSGVEYHRLLDIGRARVEAGTRRPWRQRLQRWFLRAILPYRRRVSPLLRLGQWLRPALPGFVRRKVPRAQRRVETPVRQHSRQVLLLAGCVQPAMTPLTNQLTANLLDQLGISAIEAPEAGCCGALSHHLSAEEQGRDFMRRNIDAWWPFVEGGVEAIVMTASGCGAVVKEYDVHLRDDPVYAEKAKRIAALARDLCEVITPDEIRRLKPVDAKRIAFHPPCTLQHGQKLRGVVESLLSAAGFELVPVIDSHMCCGSAGTYSILQPGLAGELAKQRIVALQADTPELIATANIGCQLHLQAQADVPVVHWVELFAAK